LLPISFKVSFYFDNEENRMKPTIQKASSRSLVLAFSNWGFSWGGILDNRKGEWWLIGQILLIAGHVIPIWWSPFVHSGIVWPIWMTFFGLCLLLLGIFKSMKAFISLGENLSPLPTPKSGSNMVQSGSYKSCRHPLYQGILLSSFGVTIGWGSIFHALLLISLSALLIGKAKREEVLLRKKYIDYEQYLKTTPAIIKWIPFLDWQS
jgi:protein-S-isoprenylcysteine O-methyltransferase Ste14